ncbi:hypothetical protein GOP47_0017273 [Adiantum capillus-veneris]|uniref:ATPase AAA-type core domain-containing protein n=1 Tax=Adiantum capillus-veneris TaxID=13818 RepID=A0A9D4ZAL2_ADICA|nr:hypothetical protein GOP47_0017273 [Adiantum capillus-veneris]
MAMVREGSSQRQSEEGRMRWCMLFDEIEKAHVDVTNIMLQILEDGRLTDSKGRTVDFKNTVLIMTSNVGSSAIAGERLIGFNHGNMRQIGEDTDDEKISSPSLPSSMNMKALVMEELKQVFRPEFLNRLDDIVVFKKLTSCEISTIADLMLSQTVARVQDKLSIAHLQITHFQRAGDGGCCGRFQQQLWRSSDPAQRHYSASRGQLGGKHASWEHTGRWLLLRRYRFSWSHYHSTSPIVVVLS